MSDVALFIIGFVIFTFAFVGSLCYAYVLLTGKFELDRPHPDVAAAAALAARRSLVVGVPEPAGPSPSL